MSRPPDPQLVEAYQLIKAGQRALAGTRLKAFLAEHPQDANGWWLMAHVVTRQETVESCLEKVLALDPDHAPAREKLARLRPPPLDPDLEFVPPDDLIALPAIIDSLPGWKASLGAEPGRAAGAESIPPVAPTGKPIPRPRRRTQIETMIGVGLVATALVILVGALVIKGVQDGWFDSLAGSPAGTLKAKNFTLQYPPEWATECSSSLFSSSQVCAFATDERYSIFNLYLAGRDEVGDESLLTSINRILFSGGEQPDLAVTGVVLDYPQSDPGYEYVRQSITWSEQEYSAKRGRTNYLQGYDLWMEYDKENPVIDGQTSYIYWLSGKDVTGQVLSRKGYFVICDAYIPHGDRMLMLTMVGYSSTAIEAIPRETVEQMISSLTFK